MSKTQAQSARKKKEITQIVYEQEDQHSVDVFKKYLFLQQSKDQSKAGQSIKNFIEMSEYYMENFKHTRDSEFSNYDDMDLTNLKELRKAEIEAIRGGKSRGLDVYHINRKQKQGSLKLEKYDRVDDIQSDQILDEDQLIAHMQKKQDEKSRLAEGIRDKQSKLMELNEQIRKYDINQVKTDELDQLNGLMAELNLQWGNLQTSLEEKMRFASKMHKKHHEEVQDYEDFSENLDKDKFNKKVKRITFELQTEQKDFTKTADEMVKDKDKLKIYLDRAKKDLDEEKQKGQGLSKVLMEQDGNMDQTNSRLRDQIGKMKNEMDRIHNYSIDIAKDPAKAIQRISDPILDLLNAKIEGYGEDLKSNLAEKKKATQDLIDAKNFLFEEKVKQINLKRKKEEINEQFIVLREDIEAVQQQMLENIKRKSELADKIKDQTDRFQEEAKELRDDLSQQKQKLVQIYKHKEIVEDQASFLLNDRGRVGSSQKYFDSVTQFIQMAKDLKIKFDDLQDRILKFDDELTIDPIYTKGQGKKAKLLPISEFYRIGKFEERDKKDTMMKDLEKKQEYILELLVQKESLEEQLAPFGNIHYIYKTFKEVQEDIKQNVKKYRREKNQIFKYLNQLVLDFEENRETIGIQEGKMKMFTAKYKAAKILEDEMNKLRNQKLKVQSAGENLSQISSISKSEEEVLAFERELIIGMRQDQKKKDTEIQSLQQLLQSRDQELHKYQKLMDEKGSMEIQEEILIEQKAKNILENNGFRGDFIRISQNAYKLGLNTFVFLKLIQPQINVVNNVHIERQLVARVSIKGIDKLKKCKEIRLEGNEVFYDFDQFTKQVLLLPHRQQFRSNLVLALTRKNDEFTLMKSSSRHEDKNYGIPAVKAGFSGRNKPAQKQIHWQLINDYAECDQAEEKQKKRETEVGEGVNMNLKIYVENLGHERIPMFGYPPVSYEEQQNPQKIQKLLLGKIKNKQDDSLEVKGYASDQLQYKDTKDFLDDNELPFKTALLQKRRQDRVMNHVFKCFTFGKKCRRQLDDDVAIVSRVDILKRRFQRLDLVRDYYSVKKRNNQRKFKYPLNELANQLDVEPSTIYDELQYAQESDFGEEINYSKKKKNKLEKQIDGLIHQSHKRKMSQSSNFTLDDLNSQLDDSVYSSPRLIAQKEWMAFDKVLPFDFITQRKAKRFYKEDFCDIAYLLENKSKAIQMLHLRDSHQNDPLKDPKGHEIEDDLNELPETNAQYKDKYRIIPRRKQKKIKNKKLVIKGELSSSSDDEKFINYRYGEKVQNIQIRDQNNDLKGIFFQRAGAKSIKTKKELMSKIAEFKNTISEQQRDVLQNRQFVIVEKKSLNQTKPGFHGKRMDLVMKEEEEKLQKQRIEHEKLDRQSKLIQHAKRQIMREKTLYSSRNASSNLFQTEGNQYNSTANDQQSQNIYLTQVSRTSVRPAQMFSGLSSSTSSVTNLANPISNNQSGNGYGYNSKNNFISPYDNSVTQRIQTAPSNPNFQRSQRMHKNNHGLHQNQTFSSYQDNFDQMNETKSEISNSEFNSKSFNIVLDQNHQQHFSRQNNIGANRLYEQNLNSNQNTSQILYNSFTGQAVKTALQDSPYQIISKNLTQFYSNTGRYNSANEKTRIKGYLAEKLRRKSVLNCELFKNRNINYKVKVSNMIDRINRVIGTNMTKTKD
ncbi:UNKNOWN [Stylonychia lemnae]|uniref:Uncharacterized protein n=1 Tax=Stylonychia lemnae TaxID=5949 RepID=A0A078AIR0_STYLE|nr:UNKNOWN [Stylonychia lemnae]|eukprot:CDW82160.1 UNKNOWN [Stylonychia lemnae]